MPLFSCRNVNVGQGASSKRKKLEVPITIVDCPYWTAPLNTHYDGCSDGSFRVVAEVGKEGRVIREEVTV